MFPRCSTPSRLAALLSILACAPTAPGDGDERPAGAGGSSGGGARPGAAAGSGSPGVEAVEGV
jgi:hypothetical protein